ncbi:glycogen debranching protein [Lachnoclostridium sp. An169]|uniref:alpha-amylase family glycosyl hydrolase n=1 Tax=Lachnoclostridium sp. An169 TaxID=1965569 RepID=UPI000B3AF1AF|nr:alpha-amylase family glycosyl hydrolase [Lachnoclostridium sp. An169]OUP86595.1 glycogen debranching protein [Lachnoclostridium sp. An169]HJA67369.1 glycogen debranching protein [Candidatus Mediterraneibacter cottocaccae]
MKKTIGRPQPFGAVVERDRVNFAVQVPAGKTCELLVYRRGEETPRFCFDMPEEEGIGEVRFLALEEIDAAEYEYNFRVGGRVYVDPYVKELAGREKFGVPRDVQQHQIRGRMVSAEYDWEDDRPLKLPWSQVVAYSLHVRGFTKHSSSKAAHKGTYLGVIEKIPYLKDLGINQIQCMPVYEFEECEKGKINYWGYGRGYYFAPKEAYAAGKSAVRELKDMVKACHREGIEVVLEMPFMEGIPAQTALECLRFYMLEYHVDGFVVNPYCVPWELLSQDPLLRGTKLMRKDDGFQNVMRRYLKGDENMVNDVIWALKHNSASDGKCSYITAQTGFTLWDLVSYDGKHNEANGEGNLDGPDYNFSWNCGVEGPSRKKAVMTLRRNQVKNAFFLLLTAQGTPCILAGDEFYNSQNGNNNVYCQDNETGWVNWSRLKTDDSLFRFVKSLIAFRKAHPCLHRDEELKGLDRTACGMPDVSYHGESAWQVRAEVSSRQLGVLYSRSGEGDEECFAAYNMHWLPHSYALPSPGKEKRWFLAACTADGFAGEPKLLEDQKSMELPERSVVLLVGKEVKQEKRRNTRKTAAPETEKKAEGRSENEGSTAFSNDHEA